MSASFVLDSRFRDVDTGPVVKEVGASILTNFKDVDASITTDRVYKKIDRIVADARRAGTLLSAASVAGVLRRTFPRCDLSEEDIADRVLVVAAHVGVPVGFGGRLVPPLQEPRRIYWSIRRRTRQAARQVAG